jgi:uncharacterized protein YjbI with pentapeptide repeats
MGLLDLLLADDVQAFNAARGRHASPALSAADLSGRKLSGVDLTKADLENADLSGAVLVEAVLVQARLDGADLTGADLREVLAHRSRWRGAYLGEARIDEGEFPRADLSDAELPGVTGEHVDMSGARLRNADLEGAVLPGVDLREAQLSGARLVGAKLVGAQAAQANLGKADLTGVDLSQADLREAKLPGVVGPGAKLAGASLVGADLTGAKLEGADFSGADLTRADLGGAVLTGARFEGALLREVRLDATEVGEAELAGALLDAATLGEPPQEDGLPEAGLQLEDLDGCVSNGVASLLWENRDAPGRSRLRAVTVPLDGKWDGRAPALAEPADLVVARALVPGPLGFQAVLFVKRPGGMVCRLTEISPMGDVGATRTVACEVTPVVRPVFFGDASSQLMGALGRRGPSFQLHRLDDAGFTPVVRKLLPTARGFVGNLEPAVLCKGGVVYPVNDEGLGGAASVPEGFPGRLCTAGRVEGELLLAWVPKGSSGLHWALMERGRPQNSGQLARDHVVANMDCVGTDRGALLVWTEEGEDPDQPATLRGCLLPDGRPFSILPGKLEEPDELRLISGGAQPVLAVVTGLGAACLVTVAPEGSKLVARIR